ncbi:hypothetical protein Nepgr_001120 [Nepenthes gracilis]|uniref:Uncharacterized protein n=1 Tax=Nepenthes gracilis TaxID=150966 RepID=A0AAD3P4B1_NEPGR|nr:hypothetical protein Nepgr_001120 [Nepenthes gracilis]
MRADHVLEEGVNAGGEPSALPVGASGKPEAEESIEPIYKLTLSQHGFPLLPTHCLRSRRQVLPQLWLRRPPVIHDQQRARQGVV